MRARSANLRSKSGVGTARCVGCSSTVDEHHWAAGVPLATSIAHKGALAGAKVMAAAIVECLKNPAIVAEAKRTFKDEIGNVEYRPLLPSDQKPPIDLNRATMDKYRPLMEKHHLVEKPVFS